MSKPESISSRIAYFWDVIQEVATAQVVFFSPPEKPSFSPLVIKEGSIANCSHRSSSIFLKISHSNMSTSNRYIRPLLKKKQLKTPGIFTRMLKTQETNHFALAHAQTWLLYQLQINRSNRK